VPIIERIAQALEAAHEQHIIHNDVKPGNILFNDKGDAFLSDFGIALLQNDKSSNSEQSIAGTPKYLSPEQVKAMLRQIEISELDGRSDIYALGVVLFEMLTGQVPYQTKTPYKTALAHITQPVPELSSYAPNLPPACQEIISRPLAKSPAERYDTAQALAADQKEASSGRWLLRQLID
jgi:serine/threonine protein kinase